MKSMKAAGVIVEYNPFHNGHYFHLQGTKKQTNADVYIAVMSGNFLQRGEPALVSKWTRAKMALQAGIDIVIELPYAFATGKAEVFSNGAISALETLFVSDICFGSEHGSIEAFENTVHYMKENEKSFNQLIKTEVAKGYSFPKASSLAYNALETSKYTVDLSLPNNILGYHYVKAIHEQNSGIKPQTLKRTGAGYHDEKPYKNTIASATGIRKILLGEDGELHKIKSLVPETTYEGLIDYYETYQTYHYWDIYFPFLQYKLSVTSPSELKKIYEAEEGLEYRVIEKIKHASSFTQFMEQIKTKRYTWTRLQRFLTHILTNTTKEEMAPYLERMEVNYVRVLGMSKQGQAYLSQIKKSVEKPIITNLKANFNDPMLNLDIRASKAYALGYPKEIRAKMLNEEYKRSPIRI
jgi:predicted nucleotidyltransferase